MTTVTRKQFFEELGGAGGGYQTGASATLGPLTRLPGGAEEYMGDYALSVVLDDQGNFAGVIAPETGRTMSVAAWNDRQVVGSWEPAPKIKAEVAFPRRGE